MKKLSYGLIALVMLTCSVISAEADVSIGIGFPNVSIGINLPLFPELVPVPGYPVYYAPRVDANYFFYDGMYWVYQDDNWYASSWYNGPWGVVESEVVPLFILRIPVRYYRQPPVYFRGWQSNAPPRWGQHWGHGWEQRRSGWDRWQRNSAPKRAPLPVYQRQYSGDRYPRVEHQHSLRSERYRYQPRDRAVREHFKQQAGQRVAPAHQGKTAEPARRGPSQQNIQRSAPLQQGGGQADPRQQQPRQGVEHMQKSVPVETPHQERRPALREQRQQPGAEQAPRSQGREQRPQERRESQEPSGHERGQGQNREEGRGRDRN